MEHQKRTLQDVIQFTAEWTSFPAAKIGATTRPGEDLGLDGDNAGEFMVEFAKRFHSPSHY